MTQTAGAFRRGTAAGGYRPGGRQLTTDPGGGRADREPGLGIDARYIRLMNYIHNRGATVIMATHNKDIVRALS